MVKQKIERRFKRLQYFMAMDNNIVTENTKLHLVREETFLLLMALSEDGYGDSPSVFKAMDRIVSDMKQKIEEYRALEEAEKQHIGTEQVN